MAHLGKHAIVIGASMGGLLAARALADHYDEVTIVERDALPEADEPRKGVPQGRHLHGLLARGREVLEQLFPNFTEEMVAQGAASADIVNQGLWFNHGVYLSNVPSNLSGLGMSRPMLEGRVRRRLVQNHSVRLREQCDALELVFDRSQGRVTGIRVQDRSGSNGTATMNGDLIVDSSGRGSPSPAWLAALGYTKPREEQIKINLGYMTRLYRRRTEDLEHLHGKLFAILGACEPDWRFGAILVQEGDRWIVTLGGYLGDQVPTSDSGFLEFARSLQKPEIFNVIKDAEPLSPPTPYQFSANLRRHYEELSRFPEGFLVYGDALCSFNPVFGQGMTVACMESLALRECLLAGTQGSAKRFLRAASRLIDTPWQIAVGSDLQHPRVEGRRTAQVRFINWYIAKYFQAAQHDGVLATKFLEVANLMQPPTALLSPGIALQVWKRNRQPTQATTKPAARPPL
jgi:2-polyprenyl-6-methoxyphenol hydroxylase-like FAD-dependent oxidoreductase